MISRWHIAAGFAAAAMLVGTNAARASVSDTYSLTQWAAQTGLGLNSYVSPTGPTIPVAGVSFGAGTSTPTETLNQGRGWTNSWSIRGGGNSAGAAAVGTVGILIISGASVTFNVSSLSAFGFFMQNNSTAPLTYSISEYSAPNAAAGSLINAETATTSINNDLQSGGVYPGTGASFIGYYGDITGSVESITVTLNPSTQAGAGLLAFGQFFTVPVPEPATIGLVGFGLAALGMVRRRKRG